jgi:predicted DNA-binding protein
LIVHSWFLLTVFSNVYYHSIKYTSMRTERTLCIYVPSVISSHINDCVSLQFCMEYLSSVILNTTQP